MTDLSAIQAGFAFPPTGLLLDCATVVAYLDAVEDTTPIYRGEGACVPPLAVLPLAMRGLADLIAQYPGTMHVSQRLVAHRAVPIGAKVTAHIAVQSRSERKGFVALNLELRVEEDGDTVLEGGMLLLVPLARAEAAHG